MRTRVYLGILILLAFVSLLALPAHAQFTTITMTNVQNGDGLPLALGTTCWVGTNNAGQPIGYRIGTSGQAITDPICRDIINGAVQTTYKGATLGTLKVADTTLTSPANVCYKVTVLNTATGRPVLGSFGGQKSGYDCVQPSGTTWSFDTYVPAATPNTVVSAGPAGPQGPPGLGLDPSSDIAFSGDNSFTGLTMADDAIAVDARRPPFNIVADGVTDQTANLNALLAYLATKNLRTVKWPAGITKFVIPQNGVAIQNNLPGVQFICSRGGKGTTATEGGCQWAFYKTGASTATGIGFQNGTDNGLAWDGVYYDGPQGVVFQNINMKCMNPDTALLGAALSYCKNVMAVVDWRGGSFRFLGNTDFENFDYGFWGVQSDFDYFQNVTCGGNHNDCIYAGPRSDQLVIDYLYSFENDSVLTLDAARGAAIKGGTTDSDGSASTCAYNVGSTWGFPAQGNSFADIWHEKQNPIGVTSNAYYCLGVGQTGQQGAIDTTIVRPRVFQNPQASTPHNVYLVQNEQSDRVEVDDLQATNFSNLLKIFQFTSTTLAANGIVRGPSNIGNFYDLGGGALTPAFSALTLGSSAATLWGNGRINGNIYPADSTRNYFIGYENASGDSSGVHYCLVTKLPSISAGTDNNPYRLQLCRRQTYGVTNPTLANWDGFTGSNALDWNQGDIVWNKAPAIVGNYTLLGWRCTVSGTPGTWVPMYSSISSPTESRFTFFSSSELGTTGLLNVMSAEYITDNPITITRVTAHAGTAPAGCTTQLVVQVRDNTGLAFVAGTSVALTNGQNDWDSGAISVNVAAGIKLSVGYSTAAAGCTTSPNHMSALVEYKMQ